MANQQHHEVAVIGAGISGLGAGVRLRQAGVENFVILEKAESVGGTWRDNTYPGCACDVPSALYSYSFAPNPEWSRAFARQPEIRDYIETVADRFELRPHLRFGVEVNRAQWDDTEKLWRLDTSNGEVTARFVVAATGPWHEPLIPDVPGLDSFEGPAFHSSRWNHDVDLAGKRVAVVGSGASAVQFVPRIQREVAELHLFQRTAQWVLPKPDHPVPGIEKLLMRRVPLAQRALRNAEYAGMETMGVGFRHPRVLRAMQRLGRRNLHKAIKDPELRAALTPDYTLGCKRILMSNHYYPALAKPNVTVRPTAVSEIKPNSVTGADGVETEVDVVIFGTGFHILDMPVADRVFDGAGRSLADIWQGSPRAYLGTTIAGFPNAFVLLGPNLGTGHSSAFMVLESQLNYMISTITRSRRDGWTCFSVKPEVEARYNESVQRALGGTVYNNGGCSSYYLDVNGRNSFSWPWSTVAMRRRVREFSPDDYVLTG